MQASDVCQSSTGHNDEASCSQEGSEFHSVSSKSSSPAQASTSAGLEASKRQSTIIVGAEAHKKPSLEPFKHVMKVIEKDSRVVVLCVLSEVMDLMGVWRKVDSKTFGGLSEGEFNKEKESKFRMWDYFLHRESSIGGILQKKQVSLEVSVVAGYPREPTLIQAATALNPSWVILDMYDEIIFLLAVNPFCMLSETCEKLSPKSFSGSLSKLFPHVKCNMVQVHQKRPPETRLADPFMQGKGTVRSIPLDEELRQPSTREYDPRCQVPNNITVVAVQNDESEQNAPTVNTLCQCFCFGGRGSRERKGGRKPCAQQPQPTEGNPVLFMNTEFGEAAVQLGQKNLDPSGEAHSSASASHTTSTRYSASSDWSSQFSSRRNSSVNKTLF